MDDHAAVSLADDEPELSAGDVTVNEGNGIIAVVATFTINLLAASGRDVSVDYFIKSPSGAP